MHKRKLGSWAEMQIRGRGHSGRCVEDEEGVRSGGAGEGGTKPDIAPTVITARSAYGSSCRCPLLPLLENMAGILIALLVLLIAGFHDSDGGPVRPVSAELWRLCVKN